MASVTAILLEPLLRALLADPTEREQLREAAAEVLARVAESAGTDGIAIVHVPTSDSASVMLAVEAGGAIIETDDERSDSAPDREACIALLANSVGRAPAQIKLIASEGAYVFVALAPCRPDFTAPPEIWMAIAAAAGEGDWDPAPPAPVWQTLLSTLEPAYRAFDENVQFTVYRPRSLPTDAWRTVLAFAHLAEARRSADPDPIAEVRRQAEAILGPDAAGYRDTTSDSRRGVPREADITLRLELPDCQVNPAERTFCWEEDVHREEFRVRAPAERAGDTIRGQLTVFLGSLLLADVPLAIPVAADAEADQPSALATSVSESCRPYRRVFASYSHADTAIVRQVERLVRSLGDSYLRDVTHLRAGEEWNSRLLAMIEEADVFQLFWSSSAMRSPYVRREWEHAISLRRPAFVRPTYWETPFPEDRASDLPPASLRALHFQHLPLEMEPAQATFDGASPAGASPAGASPDGAPPAGAPPAEAAAPQPDYATVKRPAPPRVGRSRRASRLLPIGAAAATIAAVAATLVAGGTSEPPSQSSQPKFAKATTGSARNVTATGATLTGTTAVPRDVVVASFEYGQTRAYGREAPALAAGAGPRRVAATVDGLAPATTYHYRLRFKTTSNRSSLGRDRTFTTKR